MVFGIQLGIRLFILQLLVTVYGHVDVLQIVQQPDTAVAGRAWTDTPLIIKALSKDPVTGKLSLDRTTSVPATNTNPLPSSVLDPVDTLDNPQHPGYRSFGPRKIYASVYTKAIGNQVLLSNQEIVTSYIINGYANFSSRNLYINTTGTYTLRIWIDNNYAASSTLHSPPKDDTFLPSTTLGSTESIASSLLSKQRHRLQSSSSSTVTTQPPISTERTTLSTLSSPTVAILTKPIRIIRGQATRLVVTTEPGRATGGVPFRSQPLISITDEGGNVCTEISTSLPSSSSSVTNTTNNYTNLYAQVRLYRIPVDVLVSDTLVPDKHNFSSLLRLDVPSSQSFTVPFVNGTASFQGLTINPAGDGYILEFRTLYLPFPPRNTTTLPIVSSNYTSIIHNVTVYSRSFTVGRGPTAKLVINQQPQGSRAGLPFLIQPVIELQDAGGNRNIDDSFSTVSVRIKRNGGLRKRWFEDILNDYNRTVDNIYDIYLYEQEKLISKYIGNESSLSSKTNDALSRAGFDYLGPLQAGTLGPRYRRLSYPVNVITGSIQPGSNYIQLSNDPLHLPGGLAPLRNGERIALGGRQGTLNEAFSSSTSSFERSRTNSQSDGEQSIVFPDYDSPGEIIQFIPPGQRRLKLQHPWHGPSFVDARLSKIRPGLIVPVIQGQAIFSDLFIDAVGTGYTLEFTSSLVNISYLCTNGDRKGTPRLDEDRYPHLPIDCTWFTPEASTSPFGLGAGITSAGIGYGKPYKNFPSLTNVSRTLMPNRNFVPSYDRITVESNPFTVHYGLPHELRILQPAALAWAGGQPFVQQPVIVIVDSGKNILLNRNDDIITASLAIVDPSRPHRIDHYPIARLLGTRRIRLEEGMAEFTDLSIDVPTWDAPAMLNQLQKLGYNASFDHGDPRNPFFFSKDPLSLPPTQYTLIYSAHIRGYGYMETRQTITVAPSAEYMVTAFSMNATNTVATVGNGRAWSTTTDRIGIRNGQASGADRVGHSVSMSEDLLAVGAPYADVPRQDVQVVRIIDPAGLYAADQRKQEEQSITLGVEWRPMIQRLSIRGINNTINTIQGTYKLRLTVPNEPPAESRLLYVTSHEDYLRVAIERDILYPLGYGTAVVANDDDASAGTVSVTRIPEEELDTTTIDKELMGWYIQLDGIYESIPLFEIVHPQVQSTLSTLAAVPSIDIMVQQSMSFLNGTFTLILPYPTTKEATLPFTEHTGIEGYHRTHNLSKYPAHPLTVTKNIYYETRPIPFDTDASTLASILAEDLHVGPVEVRSSDYRTPSTFTGIVGPSGQTSKFYRRWILTFPDRDRSMDDKVYTEYLCGNDVPTLYPNATGLQGYGAYASVNVLTEGVSPVQGSFILTYAGVQTPPIPVDASPSVLRAALLATKVIQDVQVSLNSDNDLVDDDDEETGYTDGTSTAANEGGPRSRIVRSWLVTFIQTSERISDGYHNRGDDGDSRILRSDSDYPQNYTRLQWIPSTGSGSSGTTTRLRAVPTENSSVLTGTAWVPWNTKVVPGTLIGGHGNVGRTNKLIGRPYVDIIAAYDTDNAPYARSWESSVRGAQRGNYGYQTGRVYLYRRRDRRWLSHTLLQANDGNEYDLFGYAVSLATSSVPADGTHHYADAFRSSSFAAFNTSHDGSSLDTLAFIAVGAPGSRQYGDYEIQHLECVASNGTFTLTYANKTTKPIPFSATANRIAAALHALPVPLHVRVNPLPHQPLSSPVCRPTLSSSFPSEKDHYGMAVTFVYPEEGDIPPLRIDADRLKGFSDNGVYLPPRAVVIDNIVQGTRVSVKNIPYNGTNATGASRGAVYVFEPDPYSPNGIYTPRWYPTAKLEGPLRSESGTLFGWSVSATSKGAMHTVQTIVVGAPGDTEDGGIDSGCVYVYNRPPSLPTVHRNNTSWNLHQRLYATTHNSHGGKGYLFGWSVSLSAEGDTLAIGAPGATQLPNNDKTGRVWIFKRQQVPDALFFIDQVLEPVLAHRNQPVSILSGMNVNFGYSVGWGENILAVGAPGSLALNGAAEGETTGSVYLYDRRGWGNTGQHGGILKLRQILNPEAAQEGDRVGLSVAASRHTVIIGSVGRYEGGQGTSAGGQSTSYGLQFGQAMYPPAPRHEVQSITLSLSSYDRERLRDRTNSTIVLSGTFVLQWRRKYISPVSAQAFHRLRTDERTDVQAEKGYTGWRSITSRRLPWNAPARMIRTALENDLRTGKVRVQRIGPSLDSGSYTWLVTFIASPTEFGNSVTSLPLLRIVSFLDIHILPLQKVNGWIRKSVSTQAAVHQLLHSSSSYSPPSSSDTSVYRLYCSHTDASNRTVSRIILNTDLTSSIYPSSSCVRLPLPLSRIVRVHSPSLPIRSASFIYVRNHTLGYGSVWWPAVALSPHIPQSTDNFGYAVTLSPSGSFASVGAPSRDNAYNDGTNGLVNGAVFTYSLDFLNMAFGGTVIDATVPLAELRTEEEGRTTLLHAYKDTVSRNHHQGIGLTGTLNVPIRVTRQCTEYVKNQDDLPSNTCLAPYVPSLVSRFRLPLGPLMMAYVTVRSGNDWGWHSSYASRTRTGGNSNTDKDTQRRLWSFATDSPIPSGYVAAHAEAHPATGSYCHLSDFIQAYGNSPYAASMVFRSPYLHSGTDWTRISSLQGTNGTHTEAYRYCPPSACSLQSLATGECHFLPENGQYDDHGRQDFVPVTRLVTVPLANTPNASYGRLHPTTNLPSTAIMYPVLLTDDNVPERTNEIFHVSFWLPGMHALPNGPLWTSIQIHDNQDGFTKDTFTQSYSNEKKMVVSPINYKNTLYVQTFVPQTRTLPYGYRWKYGTGIAIVDEQWMVIGAPYGHPSSIVNKTGIAYLLYRSRTTTDEWITVATLDPGDYVVNFMHHTKNTFPRFGTSVSLILDSYINHQNPLIMKGYIGVAAPGIPCVIVYEFMYNQSDPTVPTDPFLAPYDITLPGLRIERTAVLQPDLYQAYEQNLIETTTDLYSSSSIDITKEIYGSTSDTLFMNTNPETNSTFPRDNAKIPFLYGIDRPIDPLDKCGERHTLAMVTDGGKGIMLLLGCPGLESVFVYRNTPLANTSTPGIGTLNAKDSTLNVSSPKSRDWTISRVLRSSEYAEIRGFGTVYPFPTGFGSSVAASSNTNGITIVIGAPRALGKGNYGKRTSILSESITHHTEQGTGNRNIYPSSHTWTKPTLENIEAYVSAYETGSVTIFEFVGGITKEDYTGDVRNQGTWEELTDWRAGDSAIARNRSIHVMNDGVGDGLWIQHAILVAPNARAGDRFGASVDIDGSSLIVGAWGTTVRHGNRGPVDDGTSSASSGKEDDTEGKQQATGNDAVTWDFETGDLRGWTATGDAFQFQPVYNDNTLHRPGNYPDPVTGQPSRSVPSGHKGQYWIGTFEANPPDAEDVTLETEPAATLNILRTNGGMAGDRTTAARYAHSSPYKVHDVVNGIKDKRKPYLQGRIQGDLPTGSLTSPPFLIAGPTIAFLIGGGCNSEVVYVELLIDGEPSSHHRSTGKCSTVMQKVYWDVRSYRGRMGVIRIVDGSSASPWGHISVDEFLFSWTMEGFPHVGDSGAAFIYRRVALPLVATQDDTNIENQGQYTRTNSETRGNEPGEFTERFRENGVSTSSPSSSLPLRPIPQPRNTVPFRQPCPDDKSSLACIWHLETILRPQDARTGGLFGYSVAIDDTVGIAIVGAPYGKTLIQTIDDDKDSVASVIDLDKDTLYKPLYGIGDAISGIGRKSSTVSTPSVSSATVPSAVQDFQQYQRGDMDAKLRNEEILGKDQNPLSNLIRNGERNTDNLQEYRTVHREGHVYIYRAEPEKRAGLHESVTPRIWPTSSIHIQLPASPSKSNQNNLLGSSVVLSRYLTAWSAPEDSFHRDLAGSVTLLSLASATFISFSPVDFTLPSSQASASGYPDSTRIGGEASVYTRSAVGQSILNYRIAENNVLHEIVVPVYRHGIKYCPDNTPQALLKDQTLHIDYATRDITAKSVSLNQGAKCLALPVNERSVCTCGNYIAQTGRLTFYPGIERLDIVIRIMDDLCSPVVTNRASSGDTLSSSIPYEEHSDASSLASSTFAIDLYLPGGKRITGSGTTSTVIVTIDDDDTVLEDELDYNELFSTYQTYSNIVQGSNEGLEKLYRYRTQQHRCQRSCSP